MKRLSFIVALVSLIALVNQSLHSQPPDDREPPGGRPAGRRDGGPGAGRPGPWQPGKVMPPHVQDELKLSTPQKKQLADLEKDVKERILKILTDEQKRQLQTLRPPGPPEDGAGGPPRRGRPGPPGDRNDDRRPPPRDDAEQ